MTTPTFQQSPYLRVQRHFPYEDVKELANQSDHSYVDIAQKVNVRVIGIYPVNYSAITGENWYLTGQPNVQQGLRQLYTFTGTGNIAHGININTVQSFSNCFGSFTDGTNHYGAIYASNTAIAGQVSFYITPTNIVVIAGAGAPTITNGIIVLQWISTI